MFACIQQFGDKVQLWPHTAALDSLIQTDKTRAVLHCKWCEGLWQAMYNSPRCVWTENYQFTLNLVAPNMSTDKTELMQKSVPLSKTIITWSHLPLRHFQFHSRTCQDGESISAYVVELWKLGALQFSSHIGNHAKRLSSSRNQQFLPTAQTPRCEKLCSR